MVSCMARLSRFVAVAVLLGGATVSLSACTGGSDPVASPSPSVSTVVTPTPSASPSPTPLTDAELLALIPVDARAENFVSASNFAKFVLGQYETVYRTGDTRLWEGLSADECDFCASVIDESAALLVGGGHREGGAITVTDVIATGSLAEDGYTYVGRTYSVTETRDIDGSGKVIAVGAAGTGTANFKLKYAEGRWLIYGVETVGD